MNARESVDVLWMLICAALVFAMQGGFLCLETGVTRAKNNINVAIKNLTDFAISVTLFWVAGFAVMFGTSRFGWIGTGAFLPNFQTATAWDTAFFLFQAMFCGTAVTILSGAVAERMRFHAYSLAAGFVSVVVYPVFGHWVWNGANVRDAVGWLGAMGFTDYAGATVVHSTGGWIALAALLVIGPRAGRFPESGSAARIPRSNLPVATLGVVLLWLGWFGFNGGSTFELNESVPAILANTMVAGGAGLLGALAVGRIVTGKADVELAMNGSLAGLVSITANCFAVATGAAAIIGLVGGIVMVGMVYLLERVKVDDAVGAVPVHLGAGIWGTLAVAMFGDPGRLNTGLGTGAQLGVQLLGIVACGAWAFGVSYAFFMAMNVVFPFRVTPEDEYIGLNVSEHGERTDLVDLFTVMNRQAQTGDMTLRAPVEPFTEVGRIAERYNHLMSSLEVAVQDLRETTAAKERMESELRIGREIQMSMLPLMNPPFPERPEFSLHATVQPAREVGGDFYDFFFIDENQLCFCIGDVSDKGVPAALFMAVSKTLIKSRATDDFSSGSILTYVNKELSADNDAAMFVTVFLCILDVKTGEVVYTNAGHNPPYIRRANGELQRLTERHGPVVGAMEGLQFKEQRTTLKKGDIVLLYTDGLTEAMDAGQNLYSQQRLTDLLASRPYQSAEDVVNSAIRSVRRFAASAEQADDITILSLQFLGAPSDERTTERLELTVRNRLPEITRVNEAFAAFASRFVMPVDVVRRVQMVFDEVLSNVMSYAYRDGDEHEIDIKVEVTNDRLVVEIIDDGIPFNPFRVEPPDTEESIEDRAIGGLGIHLVRNLMNKVSYRRRVDRNVLSLVKYLNPESP